MGSQKIMGSGYGSNISGWEKLVELGRGLASG
jgi:hypothetical protein